jgi:uncharacterized protein YkwD
MFKQIYIVLLGIVLLISFTHSAPCTNNDTNQVPNQDENIFTSTQPQLHDENIFTSFQREFQQEVLEAHNTYRARHCVSPLQLNDDLSRSAQNYAQYLASINRMVQNNMDDVGQSLYMKSSSIYLYYIDGK